MSCSVSFIVPYYQIEGVLLKRCLDSLLSASLPVDYEVILVDDGTPDTSVPDWLAEWQMDTRVRYHYQVNKGLGGARNTGMQLATKEYIQFVDPDDYILPENYRSVLRLLIENNPDILAFDFRKVYNTIHHAVRAENYTILYEGSGADFMLHHNLRAGVWGYVFRRSLLQGLTFLEHTYHEDEAFTPLLYLQAGHLLVTDIPAYVYYQRRDSIMNSRRTERIQRRFTDLLSIQEDLTARLSLLEPEKRAALRRRIDQNYMSILYKLLTDSPTRAFLSAYLKRLRQQGGYPLPLHSYTWKYLFFALLTATPQIYGMLFTFRRLFTVR